MVTLPLAPVLLFVVVLARVAGLVTFAPFWSLSAAPTRVRVLLALVLALVITNLVMPTVASPPAEWGTMAVMVMAEVAIGCLYGFVAKLIFSSLEMAAHVLGAQMGFALAATINPATRAQTTVLGSMAEMLGLVILLSIDGHHWLLSAIIKSFHTIGPGGFSLSPTIVQLLLRVSADALTIGVTLAAPAIVIMLAVEFALAIAGRAAPQLQILLIGFPVKILVGLWLLTASLYFLPNAMRHVLSAIHTNLVRVMELLS